MHGSPKKPLTELGSLKTLWCRRMIFFVAYQVLDPDVKPSSKEAPKLRLLKVGT